MLAHWALVVGELGPFLESVMDAEVSLLFFYHEVDMFASPPLDSFNLENAYIILISVSLPLSSCISLRLTKSTFHFFAVSLSSYFLIPLVPHSSPCPSPSPLPTPLLYTHYITLFISISLPLPLPLPFL